MHIQLDLHGKSLDDAKECVFSNLKKAYLEGHLELRIITGRGNHKAADGTRGKIYQACEGWLQEPILQPMMRQVVKGDGHYDVHIQCKDLIYEQIEQLAFEQLIALNPDEIRRQAEAGKTDFQIFLGIAHDKGIGNYPLNQKSSTAWFLKAAEQNHPLAQLEMGNRYFLGKGVRQNDSQAIVFFRKAAEQNFSASWIAEGNLALIYCYGYGVPIDLKQGIDWLSRAAIHGHPESMRRLASYYNRGCSVLEQNLKIAFQWYQKAAEQGDAYSQYNLGVFYQSGRGIPIDLEAAFQWFLHAAQGNDADAMCSVANYYLHGVGTLVNSGEALYWLEKAKERGHCDAYIGLAGYCEQNNDYEGYIKHLSTAVEEGSLLAKCILIRKGEGNIPDLLTKLGEHPIDDIIEKVPLEIQQQLLDILPLQEGSRKVKQEAQKKRTAIFAHLNHEQVLPEEPTVQEHDEDMLSYDDLLDDTIPINEENLQNQLTKLQKKLALSQSLHHQTSGRKEHPDIVEHLNQIGGVLKKAGKFEEAHHYFSQALEMARMVCLQDQSSDNMLLAIVLNNMGSILKNLGNFSQALTHAQEALGLWRRLYAEKKQPIAHYLASSVNNVGGLLEDLGQFSEAYPYFEESLAMHKNLYGGIDGQSAHPQIAMSLNNMCNILKNLGRFSTARLYLEQALAMEENIFVENGNRLSPQYASSLNNMGVFLQSIKQDLPLARQYIEKGLAHRKALYSGTDGAGIHPDLASSLSNMGSILMDFKELEASRNYLEESLAMKLKIYPPFHPQITNTQHGLHSVNIQIRLNAAKEKIYLRAQPKDIEKFMTQITHKLSTAEIQWWKKFLEGDLPAPDKESYNQRVKKVPEGFCRKIATKAKQTQIEKKITRSPPTSDELVAKTITKNWMFDSLSTTQTGHANGSSSSRDDAAKPQSPGGF